MSEKEFELKMFSEHELEMLIIHHINEHEKNKAQKLELINQVVEQLQKMSIYELGRWLSMLRERGLLEVDP